MLLIRHVVPKLNIIIVKHTINASEIYLSSVNQ